MNKESVIPSIFYHCYRNVSQQCGRWVSKISITLFVLCLLPTLLWAQSGTYFPPSGEWERRSPEAMGMDSAAVAAAVELALANTVVEPNDVSLFIESAFGREPHFSILGPVKERIAGSGVVIKDGYIVAEWGDVEREDMTFSVAKSYLSTVVGVAVDDGLIRDVHDRVSDYFPHESFSKAHNAPITWAHFLHQTSDWSGTLWGKPDWADRPADYDPAVAINREMHEPGTFYKYNDTRVNMLAFSMLNVWRRPLDEVLNEHIMAPIGASDEWQWHGYENSWVEIDGKRMQSPSGGAHWGGGFFISTLDHARMGYLFLHNGNWDDEQLISEQWIAAARTPSPINPRYGFLWWLNTNQEAVPAAPASAFYATGAGGNYIWIDQENDLLIVLRWIPRLAPVISAFTEAVESR
ncbi:MAG: serine hydrolase domain-containing protein [Pseudohongiellaceae bacterium]